MLDAKKVGESIRKMRESRHLTQEVLSGLADLDRTHYSKIERGQRLPTLETIFKIAQALEISPSELVHTIETDQTE